MQNQLQKAINLAKITGDRIIVIDSSGSEAAFAVMNLKEYEEFILGQNEIRDLTEEELLNRINRDVAIWKSENDRNFEKNGEFTGRQERNKMDAVVEDNLYYYQEPESAFTQPEPEEDEDEENYNSEEIDSAGANVSEDYKPKNHWEIPRSVKSSAEEVIEDAIF